MNLEEIYRPARRELQVAEERLLEFTRLGDEGVSESLSEIVSGGGKRLRPALLLMAAKACGYTGQRGIELAVAVELIHTASLIHDDIIDNADLRRGIPTINSRWGNKVSVLVGDYLYSEVIGVLAEDGDLEVMGNVISTARDMTDSEMTQTLRRHDVNVTEDEYLDIIAGKTARLMSCSCRIGAMLGEVHNGQADILGDYGLNLGMAFQITDDMLDLMGEEERLGKPRGNDIREGRLTLPLIHAIGTASEEDREWMVETFMSGHASDDALTRIGDIVRQRGGMEYSLERATQYCKACKEQLELLGKSDSRSSLAMLADYVAQRACQGQSS